MTPAILRADAARYRRLLALGMVDERTVSEIRGLIAECERRATLLETAVGPGTDEVHDTPP